MVDTITKTREHVLWNVKYQLGELAKQVSSYEQMQGAWGGLGLMQAFASFRLAQLRPKVLWWNEIKTAIESDEPKRAMSALERLIRHYRPSKFFLTWLAPLSSHAGFAMVAAAFVAEDIREAKTLRDHYHQQIA